MSIRVVIDMNLSPDWAETLSDSGWPAQHWSTVGDPRATDAEIIKWARTNSHIVLTHDLDFGTLLALTHADGPSVIQIRSQDPFPQRLAPVVSAALKQHAGELEKGALLVIDEARARVRVLPI